MSGDFVVVVDADLSAFRALVEGLPSDTYDVVSVATARAGFNVACALEPHVIVASLDLPDADALELASVIRGHDTRVAYTPIVVLTMADDEGTRLSVLQSGADVVLSAPIDPTDLVAQVNAMIAMGERIRELERGQSMLPPASDGAEFAMLGDPTKMSVASVLGALELEQRSGELRFSGTPDHRRLSLFLASGTIAFGALDGEELTPLDALKTALNWPGTQFGFVARHPVPLPEDAKPLATLLIAAFNASEPSARMSFELEASQRLLGESSASLRLAESIVGLHSSKSIRIGESQASLRLEDTAAGRRFLHDTAAGLRLTSTSTGIRLSESVAGLKLTETSTGIRVGNTTGGKVAEGQAKAEKEDLTTTLASFDQRLSPLPEVPVPPENPRASRPDLPPEKAAMRGTFRGIDVTEVLDPSREE